jgi:ribosomal protein S18 acetylase RimI-like enzyme
MASTQDSRVAFASLTLNNVGTVRKLNTTIIPVKYSDSFYHNILQPEVEDFCKLVYYNDIPVGTIACRLENKDSTVSLYCMTMAILAPYRDRKLGSQCLESVISAASSHTKPQINRIYLHVQISNDAAKRFYERHGFKEMGISKDYYKKIEPRDAWILEKVLHS